MLWNCQTTAFEPLYFIPPSTYNWPPLSCLPLCTMSLHLRLLLIVSRPLHSSSGNCLPPFSCSFNLRLNLLSKTAKQLCINKDNSPNTKYIYIILKRPRICSYKAGFWSLTKRSAFHLLKTNLKTKRPECSHTGRRIWYLVITMLVKVVFSNTCKMLKI